MGLFFDDPKPKVTFKEWREKVRSALSAHGLQRKELDFVEGVLHGHFMEKNDRDEGMQIDEIEAAIENLKKNRRLHTLSDQQIGLVEEELRKRL